MDIDTVYICIGITGIIIELGLIIGMIYLLLEVIKDINSYKR